MRSDAVIQTHLTRFSLFCSFMLFISIDLLLFWFFFNVFVSAFFMESHSSKKLLKKEQTIETINNTKKESEDRITASS